MSSLTQDPEGVRCEVSCLPWFASPHKWKFQFSKFWKFCNRTWDLDLWVQSWYKDPIITVGRPKAEGSAKFIANEIALDHFLWFFRNHSLWIHPSQSNDEKICTKRLGRTWFLNHNNISCSLWHMIRIKSNSVISSTSKPDLIHVSSTYFLNLNSTEGKTIWYMQSGEILQVLCKCSKNTFRTMVYHKTYLQHPGYF